MKSLTFIALSVVASAAMATGPAPSSSTPEIKITGNSTQSVSLISASVSNKSTGSKSEAIQNLASNSGDVSISGNSAQSVSGMNSSVNNEATGSDAYASQNVSSNVGDVAIGGNSTQTTHLMFANLSNLSSGSNSKAVQNVASNNACFTCAPGATASNSGGGHRS